MLPAAPHVPVRRQGLEKFGVELRDTVDRVAADRRDVCHTDIALGRFVDQRQCGQLPLVAEVADAHLIEKSPVDLEEDLHMPREHALHQLDGPAFERFWQQCVVRIGESLARDRPRLVPIELVLVDE